MEHLVGVLIFIPTAYGTIREQNSVEIVTKHPPSMTWSAQHAMFLKICGDIEIYVPGDCFCPHGEQLTVCFN